MQTEKLDPAVEFLKSVENNENIGIIHHWDMDGTSSSTIISKILEEVRGRPADWVSIPEERAYHLSKADHKKIEDLDKLIVLDFNLEADEMEQLLEDYDVEILMVDHHSFDEKPEGVSFVNPREFDAEVYVPCSKICLDIAEQFGLKDELRWIAGMGVIQDFGVDSCPELFDNLEEEYDKYLPDEKTQQKLAKECEYGRYSSILNIKPYRNSQKFAKLAYQALMKSDSLMEIEAQEEYRQVYEVYIEMQDEFNDVLENYEEEREIDRDKMVIFFELDSQFNINSSIATNMSTKTPEWIHLVVQKDKNEVNISGRCQSGRVDLGTLLQEALPEKAVEDGAEGGGHRKAAGASMHPDYYPEFKSNFLKLVE